MVIKINITQNIPKELKFSKLNIQSYNFSNTFYNNKLEKYKNENIYKIYRAINHMYPTCFVFNNYKAILSYKSIFDCFRYTFIIYNYFSIALLMTL